METDIIVFLLLIIFLKLVDSKNREGRIVGGEFATIENYPYSAFLSVACKKLNWMCGGSIVNQAFILSAGHCVEGCSPDSTSILVTVGDRNKLKGKEYLVHFFKLHEKYDGEEIYNDISLIKLQRNLEMGPLVSRVSLLTRTPKKERASLAGWGVIDEKHGTETKYLKHLSNLEVITREQCKEILQDVPKGTICAGSLNDENYGAQGDSGCALTVRNYIQIGLVSYKVPDYSDSVVIYTEIAYFHNWISSSIKKLFCKP